MTTLSQNLQQQCSWLCELVEGKRESYRREKRYIRKDGTVIWAELTAAVVRDDQGVARYIAIMVQDISERKRIEQALRESEEKFRRVVENAPDGIIVFQGTKIIYANPRAAEFLGYSVDELLSMNFWDFVHLSKSHAAATASTR